MSIEAVIALAATIIGCAIGIAGWIAGGKRQVKSDTKEDTTVTTTMLVKLDFISNTLSEIKADNNILKQDVRDFREQQIADSASLKAAWKAIEELKKMAAYNHE